MKEYYRSLLNLSAVLGLASTGCAHLGTSPGSAGSARLDKYFPLAVGNSWTYATSFQEQPQPDLTVSIVKEKEGFFFDDRPTPSRLRFDTEGLRDGKVRYLLKAPLELGQQWMSVADVQTVEHYEIVGVGEKVRVPAGVFDGCVMVKMEVKINKQRSMINQMTFAPGVGIVEIYASLKEGSKLLPQSRMVLKNYALGPGSRKG